MKDEDLVHRIKQVIDYKGIKVNAFAKLIGFNQSNLSKILRGERGVPADLTIKILDKVNINRVWLLTGEGEMLNNIEVTPVPDAETRIYKDAGNGVTYLERSDGRCVYNRNKTGRLYDIGVQPEAMAIIEKYRGERHLLRPLDFAVSVNGYTRRMNDALKSIGEAHKALQRDDRGNIIKRKDGRAKWHVKKDPLFPELTTYWARHTWASIAASLDIPKETISKALGHADEKTADIYIDFDMRKIDEANRRVIDWVLYGKS